MGVLSTLKTSHRNCAPNRSVKWKFLNTEKSQFLKPESRKMFRPMLPKVPNAGGTRNDLPWAEAKHPKEASVPGEGAFAVHPLIALVVCAADKRDGPYMETTVQLTLAVVLTPVVKPPQ